MPKKFNITGICRPAKHYMADVGRKLAQTLAMVEEGDYFIINRPRQYGKTTLLYALAEALHKSGKYIVFNASFEGLGDAVFADEKLFASRFVGLLLKHAQVVAPSLVEWLGQKMAAITDLDQLSQLITDLVKQSEQEFVLIIDEVDKSSNNQLFISFLGMLRSKYLESSTFKTFHSVVLAGGHDIRSLKLQLRPDAEQKFNSPWNIAADFTVDLNLQPQEIVPMLVAYAQDNQIELDPTAIAERLFYYTSGHPFLVSKLCKIIDEQLLPNKSTRSATRADVDVAASIVVRESNTNFQSLIKNLEHSPDLYKLVYKKLVELEYQSYSIHDPTVALGLMYGILKNGQGINIHNRIYEEIIYAYMASKATAQVLMDPYNLPQNFRLPNNQLNLEAILLKFQAFMREQDSSKDRDFLERNGRLVFLAFIKPIINGAGFDFKEPQISEERRLDVVMTYWQHKYVAELKIWRGPAAHAAGLAQLADYLERQGLNEGYLIVFDHAKKKTWQSSWETVQGKRIFVVWV